MSLPRERAALHPNVEVIDKDGIQLLWRSMKELKELLDGKTITTVMTPLSVDLNPLGVPHVNMMIVKIQIVDVKKETEEDEDTNE